MDWKAQWIWHPERPCMNNFYMYARKEIDIDSPPESATVYITAGSLYKLFVNGEYVGRGPNPSDPSRYYYDVYNMAPFLRKGRNVLAVIAYNYGPEIKGIIGQNWGRGGLLAELRGAPDCRSIAMTDGTWKVIQSPSWDQNSPVNCTLYHDYKEYYDSRHEPEGWMLEGFDDSEWTAPEVLGPPPLEPYTTLVEREIPPLSGERVYAQNIYWESASVTYAWRDDWEVYNEWALTEGRIPASEKPVEITKTHEDFSPSLILDFGKLVTGYPRIRIRNSDGGVIDCLYGESLYLTREDRFILKGGEQALEPFNRRTFRYMKLLFQETPSRIDLEEISLKMNTYPVEPLGRFRCSDPVIDRIWDVARHTIRLSMLDNFVDCPRRERTIYGGDIYPENLIAHYAFGDPRMNRKVLRQMFAIQYPEGALPPYGPYRGCHGFYPSWSGYFGLAFLDHWELTGDEDFLNELWQPFARLADWTAGEIERNEPHLIGTPEKGGAFEKWHKAPKVSFDPWNNAPFYALLERASTLAESIGYKKEARRWKHALGLMTESLLKHMVDSSGRFVKISSTSKTARENRQYDTALLLWMGLLNEDGAQAALQRLFDPRDREHGYPFAAFFLIEGLFRYERNRQAVDYIRDYWGSMLERGATTFWELYSRNMPDSRIVPSRNASHCHGWSAGPIYALGAHVLGVRPLSPGFKTVLVAPRTCGLSWAQGAVPTPAGAVEVQWHEHGSEFLLRLRAPSGAPVRVDLEPVGRIDDVMVDGKTAETRREGGSIVLDLEASDRWREVLHRRRRPGS